MYIKSHTVRSKEWGRGYGRDDSAAVAAAVLFKGGKIQERRGIKDERRALVNQ